MKVFLKRILIFFLVAIPGYCVILVAWSNLIPFEAFKKNMNYKMGSYGHMFTRLQEADTISKVDVLVLGSSHAYRGFDPRVFQNHGISVFVLGSSSQTPLQALGLVQEYVPKIQPKLVVYEVYPGIFQNDGVESSLDILANHELSWNDVKMAFEIRHLKTFNVLVNDVFRETIGLNDNFTEPLTTSEDQYVKGGYVEKIDFKDHKKKNFKESSYTLRPQQIEAFERIITYLKSLESEVVLVQAPISGHLYKTIKNNEEVDKLLSSYALYYNFNGKVNLDDQKDFYDNHHLTQSGVEKFNKVLIETLMEEGYLK